jgi:hypothetical protein
MVGGALLLLCQECLLDIKITITYDGIVHHRFFEFEVGGRTSQIEADVSAAAWAATANWSSALEILLENRPAGDGLRGKGRENALSNAASYGHMETVNLLVGGLDEKEINAQNDDGSNALLVAAQFAQETVVRLLLRKGIEWHYDKKGRSPLWWAAQGGQLAIIRIFLENGSGVQEEAQRSITQPDFYGDDPIVIAVKSGHFPAFNMLLNEKWTEEKEMAYYLRANDSRRKYFLQAMYARNRLNYNSWSRKPPPEMAGREHKFQEIRNADEDHLTIRELDAEFNAKRVLFLPRKSPDQKDRNQKASEQSLPDVKVSLLLDSNSEYLLKNDSLQWIHLPANNVR